jgi:hypothetical protein
MSNEPKVPWLVWAIVTLLCAAIAAYGAIEAANRSTQNGSSNPEPSTFNPDPPPTFTPRPAFTPETRSLEFSILNELGSTQVSEDVQVYIEGKLIAQLAVNQQKPTDSVKIRVPNSGNYSYTVIADGYFINQFGQIYRAQGRGDGIIEVREGSIFTLMVTQHGIRLVPR